VKWNRTLVLSGFVAASILSNPVSSGAQGGPPVPANPPSVESRELSRPPAPKQGEQGAPGIQGFPERRLSYYREVRPGFHLNHRLLLQDDQIRNYFYPDGNGQSAEQYLRDQMGPFMNRDSHGEVLLSFSKNQINFLIKSVSGQEVWLFRWNTSQKK